MALPDTYKQYESFTEAQWLELANSADAAKRKIVANCIRDLGVAPSDYMTWDAAARVAYILSKAEPEPAAASTGKTGGGKGKASATTATASSTSTAGVGIDPAVIKELNDKLDENNALLRKIHDLLVVQIFSDPKVKANAEEMDVVVDLLGNG